MHDHDRTIIHHDNQPITLLARVRLNDGDYITRSDITAITVRTFDTATEQQTGTTVTPDKDQAVFDTLQLDGRWGEDATGYDLLVELPANHFPKASRTYQTEATLAPIIGQPFRVYWTIYCRETYSA